MNVVVQEKVSTDNMYEHTGSHSSTGVIYTEILRKEQPVVTKVALEQSSLPSNNNEQESTKISVRDLVKKFNRQ